ncbi:aminomethyltransferase family protein [Rhodococcus sp. KRD162]|uniref:aminomethyltransferase family protein n=1 Tax=unclassified Rhodococcus (in: high G+C Gram-positive bacteria) TaxID=192944 RepID=UPI0019D2B57A|nr:aminomethyltransferase family protein [Rhodococcus sp. KRD162]
MNTNDYRIIREAAAVYPITSPLIHLEGDDRLELLDTFLSKSSDFADPDTTREALALRSDGSPFALVLQVEGDEDTWLIPRTPTTAAEISAYVDELEVPAGVTVSVAPEGWSAIAVEGPLAPRVAEHFVDGDIEDLLLHSVVDVECDSADGASRLARVGTTGEYGYLLLTTDGPADLARFEELAAAVDGGIVSGEGLARVRAEAGMPYYDHGFGAMTVAEADLSWIVDWERIGEFLGSDELVRPTATSPKLTPIVTAPGSPVTAGAPVHADGERIGTVVWTAAAGNATEELAFALLDDPFVVPALEVSVDEISAVTVTLPRVLSRSSAGASA